MKKLTIAATITAIAMALSAPFALAQTTPEPNTAPPAASPSPRGYEMGPGMMYNQGQVQGQGQGQVPGNGPGMMGGYGFGWMGGYGGMWAVILLVLAAVGLAAWVVTHRRK